jgi:hypothetical protein
VSALRSSLAATLAVFLPLAGELAFCADSGDVIDFFPAAISSSRPEQSAQPREAVQAT